MIEEIYSVDIPYSIKKLGTKCRKNNEIVNGLLTKNYLFKSQSYAFFYSIMHTNGRKD